MRDRMKRALGWLCYRIVMALPCPPPPSGIHGWLLSWAGHYANQTKEASE